MTEEVVIDDKQVKEDADKIVKIHSMIERLFPDKDVLIDYIDGEIKWSVKIRSEKWKSK